LIQVSSAALAALFGAVAVLATLAGIAVTWGVNKATIHQLKELVGELRTEVGRLRGEVADLRVALARVEGAEKAREHNTGKHPSVN
jgi:uncharacterized membrane protein